MLTKVGIAGGNCHRLRGIPWRQMQDLPQSHFRAGCVGKSTVTRGNDNG